MAGAGITQGQLPVGLTPRVGSGDQYKLAQANVPSIVGGSQIRPMVVGMDSQYPAGGAAASQGTMQQMQQQAQQQVQQQVQQMQQPMQQMQQAQSPAQPPNIFNAASQGINQGIKAAGMETMYQPGTIAGTDLTQYTNPYDTQVVQNTLGDLDRQRQIEANQLAAQATARGAFGGSRDALMQSELSRNYGQQAANTSAQLRQAGFQNAQQMAGQDIGYGLQGSQNRQQAASTLGQLSNLGFGMGTELQNQSMQQGALEQGINQLILDAGKQQWAGYTGAPATSLGYMNAALGVTPTPTTTTQTRNPGLFDYLTLGAQTAGSIYGR